MARSGEEDVFGFQVAMNDAFGVGGGQAVRDRNHLLDGLAPWDRRPAQPLAQRLTLQQLGNDEGDAVYVSDVVDCQDVGMRECGDGFRLALEARQRVGIIR